MAGKKGSKGKKSEAPPNPDAKTPYQGKRRTFGWFRCPECQRSWASAYSWANCSQKCDKCKIDVYPHRQAPPEKCDDVYVSDPEKNHQQALCQKCKEVGHFCGKGQGRRSKGSRRRRGRRAAAA